jgi:hypothetical protein
MYPKFVTFKLVTDSGNTTDLPVNPMSVISVLAITIPGKLSGPSGEPMSKKGAGLDIGFRIIPVDHTPEEAQAMLEGAGVSLEIEES